MHHPHRGAERLRLYPGEPDLGNASVGISGIQSNCVFNACAQAVFSTKAVFFMP